MNPIKLCSWWLRFRLAVLLRAVASGAAGSDALFVGIASLVLGSIRETLSPAQKVDEWPNDLLLLGAIATILSIVATSRSLKGMSPEDETTVSLEGRPAEYTIQSTAYEIWTLCHNFFKSARINLRALEKNQQITFLYFDDVWTIDAMKRAEEELSTLEEKILQLKRTVAKQNLFVRRIEHRIAYVAGLVNSVPTQTADFLFQFDPNLFQQRSNKLLRNWLEISRYIRMGRRDDSVLGRVRGILDENERIIKDFNERSSFQLEILNSLPLTQVVISLSGEVSASHALMLYARALQNLALGKSEQKVAESKTLYYKRRVHSGFDAHLSLKTMAGQQKWNNSKSALERINERTISTKDFDSLCDIGDKVDVCITKARTTIEKEASKIFSEWYEELGGGSKPVFLVHGYSKTVRGVIRAISETIEKPTLFFLASRNVSEQFLSMYEIGKRRVSAAKATVLSGDVELLKRYVQSWGADKVALFGVFGAQCFNEARDVAHSRGVSLKDEDWKSIEGLCVEARRRIVVVAEEYKLRDDLITDSNFYLNFSGSSTIINGEHVDVVVSDRPKPRWRIGLEPKNEDETTTKA